jgi:hypothetical protein
MRLNLDVVMPSLGLGIHVLSKLQSAMVQRRGWQDKSCHVGVVVDTRNKCECEASQHCFAAHAPLGSRETIDTHRILLST